MILQQLNTFAHEDRESLKRYYDYAKEQNLDFFENYSFENYIDFLDHYGLIVENKEGIGITTLGVDFLKFITETNKNINKPNYKKVTSVLPRVSVSALRSFRTANLLIGVTGRLQEPNRHYI